MCHAQGPPAFHAPGGSARATPSATGSRNARATRTASASSRVSAPLLRLHRVRSEVVVQSLRALRGKCGLPPLEGRRDRLSQRNAVEVEALREDHQIVVVLHPGVRRAEEDDRVELLGDDHLAAVGAQAGGRRDGPGRASRSPGDQDPSSGGGVYRSTRRRGLPPSRRSSQRARTSRAGRAVARSRSG